MNLIGYDPYCPVELAAQRGSQFRYRAFYVPHLREGLVEGIDDVHGHALDRALRDAHPAADDLIHREVVDRLLHAVLGSHSSEFRGDLQIDRKAVAYLAFEFVAAVQGPELHALEFDAVFHPIRR